MTKHYIILRSRRIEVYVVPGVFDQSQLMVEVKRTGKAAGVCKGQTFVVDHDQVFKLTGRQLHQEKKAKAFQARMRQRARAAKAVKPDIVISTPTYRTLKHETSRMDDLRAKGESVSVNDK